MAFPPEFGADGLVYPQVLNLDEINVYYEVENHSDDKGLQQRVYNFVLLYTLYKFG